MYMCDGCTKCAIRPAISEQKAYLHHAIHVYLIWSATVTRKGRNKIIKKESKIDRERGGVRHDDSILDLYQSTRYKKMHAHAHKRQSVR